MIERLIIQNFKALKGVALDLTPMHVLIGANDSGKTSILEAIAALSRSVDMPLTDAFPGPWEGRELVWMGTDSKICFDLNNGWYKLAVGFAESGRSAHVAYEEYLGKAIPETGTETAVYGKGRNIDTGVHPLFHVHTQLARIHSYRWIPELLSLPCAAEPERTFQMETHGFGLALCLDDILGFDRERFGRLESRFRTIFPQVKSLRLLQSPAFRVSPHSTRYFPALETAPGKGLFFDLGHSHPVPAREMSDGMLLVLAYLTILYLPAPPHFLLIEEPENGIHPARLKEIIAIVRQLVAEQGRTQVIMTTHSPYLLDLFQPEEVTLCGKQDDGSVRVTRLSESPAVLKQKNVFALGEIWTGEGDEALAKAAATDGSK